MWKTHPVTYRGALGWDARRQLTNLSESKVFLERGGIVGRVVRTSIYACMTPGHAGRSCWEIKFVSTHRKIPTYNVREGCSSDPWNFGGGLPSDSPVDCTSSKELPKHINRYSPKSATGPCMGFECAANLQCIHHCQILEADRRLGDVLPVKLAPNDPWNRIDQFVPQPEPVSSNSVHTLTSDGDEERQEKTGLHSPALGPAT